MHLVWTSRRGIELALGAFVVWAATSGAAAAFGAATFSVTATPATPGGATASQPVKLAVRASLTAASGSPPPLRTLSISLPNGFTTTLPAIASCVAPDFAARGSSACPVGSRLGTGRASFVYTSGGARIPAATDEVVLFHGERAGARSALYLFAHISKPVAFSFSLPGAVEDRAAPAGPLVTFDLSGVAQLNTGGAVSLASAAFDIERGVVGGPCPADIGWTFAARLEYVSGAVEEPRSQAPCSTTPDTTAPSLRVRARDGSPATGARFVLRLSEPATVRVALERRAGGQWRAVRRLTASVREGSSTLRVRSIDNRRLPRGHYRARLRAFDAAGLASAKRTVTFRLR
jgi:hypothetical protein